MLGRVPNVPMKSRAVDTGDQRRDAATDALAESLVVELGQVPVATSVIAGWRRSLRSALLI
jgi:hypothetical protein